MCTEKESASSTYRRERDTHLNREEGNLLYIEKRDILSSSVQGRGLSHIHREEIQSLRCTENEYVILSMEKRDTLLCKEKEYVIIDMRNRDTLPSAQRMSLLPL